VRVHGLLCVGDTPVLMQCLYAVEVYMHIHTLHDGQASSAAHACLPSFLLFTPLSALCYVFGPPQAS
jgi:hypothetical protein